MFAQVTIAEFRRAYNGGRATGVIDTLQTGITYAGKRIASMEFVRNGVVRFTGETGNCLAMFQDVVAIDD